MHSKYLPRSYGNWEELNEEIKRMYRVADGIISFAIKSKIQDTVNFVKRTFHPHCDVQNLESKEAAKVVEAFKQKEVNKDFFFQLDEYIESKRRKVCKGMLGVYRQLRDRLKAFQIFDFRPTFTGSLFIEPHQNLMGILLRVSSKPD